MLGVGADHSGAIGANVHVLQLQLIVFWKNRLQCFCLRTTYNTRVTKVRQYRSFILVTFDNRNGNNYSAY